MVEDDGELGEDATSHNRFITQRGDDDKGKLGRSQPDAAHVIRGRDGGAIGEAPALVAIRWTPIRDHLGRQRHIAIKSGIQERFQVVAAAADFHVDGQIREPSGAPLTSPSGQMALCARPVQPGLGRPPSYLVASSASSSMRRIISTLVVRQYSRPMLIGSSP